MDLDALRQAIDAIDDEILDLLSRRARLLPEIIAAKQAQGLPVVDPERERALLDRLAARGAAPFPPEAVRAVFREILSASVSLQQPIRVSFLGPPGTWSHVAARRMFGFAPRYIEEPTIALVVDAVRRGRSDHGVVPIENSTEGSVSPAVDALLEGGVRIRRELILPIEHCLMARTADLGRLRRVFSHAQALEQCRGWLAENLPRVQLVQTASTTVAVQEAAGDPDAAAVGSPFASELFGLPVIRERIQDHSQNATRFLMVSTEDAVRTGHDRTTVAFALSEDGEKGALRRALADIEDAGVNMTRIESRPRAGTSWRYVFIADLVGHRSDPTVADAIERLAQRSEVLRVLGSYPRFVEAG